MVFEERDTFPDVQKLQTKKNNAAYSEFYFFLTKTLLKDNNNTMFYSLHLF